MNNLMNYQPCSRVNNNKTLVPFVCSVFGNTDTLPLENPPNISRLDDDL